MTKRKKFERLFTELTGITMDQVRRDEFGYFWVPPEIHVDQLDQEKAKQLRALSGVYQRGPIDDIVGIGGIWMRPPYPRPRTGTKVNRHEFYTPNEKGGAAYVVFDGAEDTPFWNRPNDGIRFVYTNWNYRHCMHLARRRELVHVAVLCDGSEFYCYRDEARRKHKEPPHTHTAHPVRPLDPTISIGIG